MTIDEAIQRYADNAEYERAHGNLQGCLEFKQLANWLKELKQLKEQEPCEDAVSRKAVLNTLDFTDKFLDETRTVESYKTLLEECYKNLPSVTPIHKDRTVQDFVDKCRECGKQRWIPCSERLPNESGKYWCTFSGTNLMGIDFYTTESYAKKWFDEPEEYIGWESKNVSAWMPLPEPYKVESEGEE